jgi:hypothetical protein
MPTQEVRRMTQPQPESEPLVQPTANEINDRNRLANDEAPSVLPGRLDHHERMRIRAAMSAAKRTYPAPVAKVLVAEMSAWEEFGYRWGRPGTVGPLIDCLLKPPVPVTDAA